MHIFKYLQHLRLFERQHLSFVETLEDMDIVHVIGHHQALGVSLTLKQIRSSGIGSSATIERRLARLKRLGIVTHTQAKLDKRNVELRLSPRTWRTFQRYAEMIGAINLVHRNEHRPE